MKTVCCRLHRGDDLLLSIKHLAQKHHIAAGVILSGVGCVSVARVRDASRVKVQNIDRPCEIVSLQGTVSAVRCHLHVAFSDETLATFGGHLVEGCLINTTCELVIGILDGWHIDVEQDKQTGYDELIFREG